MSGGTGPSRDTSRTIRSVGITIAGWLALLTRLRSFLALNAFIFDNYGGCSPKHRVIFVDTIHVLTCI
jgi:hypothetical protein